METFNKKRIRWSVDFCDEINALFDRKKPQLETKLTKNPILCFLSFLKQLMSFVFQSFLCSFELFVNRKFKTFKSEKNSSGPFEETTAFLCQKILQNGPQKSKIAYLTFL